MYGITVADYGMVGDGVHDDSPAIQAALDSEKELVVIPYGIYKIGTTLRISSKTRLKVHPLAELIFADHAGVDQNSFLITNKHHHEGDRDINIEGGIWDGNNPNNPRGPDKPGSYSGVLINFSNVQGLTLRSLTLRDAESYFVRLGKVTDFLVEKITFQTRHLRPNQDGIHIKGFCEDGIIRHIRGFGPQTPNDDMVAIVADDALQRAQNLSGFNGPIRHIRVEDIQADSCHSFIRLLSYQNPVEDVEIYDVRGGCRLCAINMDACRDCRVKLFDEADYPDGVGHISGVKVQKMHVYRTSADSKQPLIDFRTRVHDFSIEDFRRDERRDVSPETATFRITQTNAVDLVLEGITAGQLSSTIIHNSTVVHDSTAMVDFSQEERFRSTYLVQSSDTLNLPYGGFTLLKANVRGNDI